MHEMPTESLERVAPLLEYSAEFFFYLQSPAKQ